jgi:hypothetical protein
MESLHIDGTNRTSRKSSLDARPLSLLVSIVRENGGGVKNQSRHKAAFISLIKQEGYDDFLDALLDEWVRIKYSTAASAAFPPTAAEMKARVAEQKSRKAKERAEIDKAKLKITRRALDLIMPNKKPLAKCTGAECVAFGGWIAKIGARVGPNRLVGDVLTNKDLIKMANESTP